MFTGDLATGYTRPEVVANLARLSGQSPDWIARHWFSGKPVRIETVASEQDAARWRRDFADAGALLLIVPADESAVDGSHYVAGYSTSARTEEPTLASLNARIPAIRQRNQAFMLLGGLALLIVLIVATVLAAIG